MDQHVSEAEDGWIEMQRQADEAQAEHLGLHPAVSLINDDGYWVSVEAYKALEAERDENARRMSAIAADHANERQRLIREREDAYRIRDRAEADMHVAKKQIERLTSERDKAIKDWHAAMKAQTRLDMHLRQAEGFLKMCDLNGGLRGWIVRAVDILPLAILGLKQLTDPLSPPYEFHVAQALLIDAKPILATIGDQ